MTQTDEILDLPEDRTLPAIVYALYLLGLANGLTILIGLIIAYANRTSVGPRMASHYTFLIRTFWIGLIVCVAAGVLVLFGAILSFILIGIPFLMLGIAIWGVVGLWFIIRCVVGLIHLSRGDAYPRPENLII
ncbi:MAG: DUF4870 family protein [Phenylobacterium sp.]|uniref:DUF4870 family protein n=1 Tax=Phenylobacterium sp. TaxID=1871053 RepID=UPI0039192BA5